MKEIEFEEIWLRVPQPPGTRTTGTVSYGFESLSHRNRETQPPFRFCGFESLSHRNHREREPKPRLFQISISYGEFG